MKRNQREFYNIIWEKAALKEKWKKERISSLENASLEPKFNKKKRDFSLGLRGFETYNPASKKEKNVILMDFSEE